MTCWFVSLTPLKTQGHVQPLGRCCPPPQKKAFRSPWACVLIANSTVICRINTASHSINVYLSPPEVNIIKRNARSLAPRNMNELSSRSAATPASPNAEAVKWIHISDCISVQHRERAWQDEEGGALQNHSHKEKEGPRCSHLPHTDSDKCRAAIGQLVGQQGLLWPLLNFPLLSSLWGWLLKPGSLVPGKSKSIWAFSLK